MPAEETKYRIEALQVQRLWGHRNVSLDFHDDVNILIGPNGCGKTTILNLLRYVLTGDVYELSQIGFEGIVLKLREFGGAGERTVKVQTKETGFVFRISSRAIEIPLSDLPRRGRPTTRQGLRARGELKQVAEELQQLVPAVWLPVARRLPIPDDEADEFQEMWTLGRRRHGRLESVDERLLELLQELSAYRGRLDAQLSNRYKEFERAVLQLILYRKEFDSRQELGDMPTEEDKQQLINAFADAQLLDPQMRRRIDEHFASAASAIKELDSENLTWEGLLVLPLIPRTKAMVRLASQLEEQRVEIFSQLRTFEDIANEFLHGKSIAVADDGRVSLSRTVGSEQVLFPPDQLSSGEKQILILLIEALLREGEPVVYVADEPELSLHIEWQEKLLASLIKLAQQVQVIVATHSPDIVGPFRDRVIRMEVPE